MYTRKQFGFLKMIDWVTALVNCTHNVIQGGSFMVFDEDAVHIRTGIRSKMLVGSHSSSIQVQTNLIDEHGRGSQLYISGNPSKFLQGHNVVGSDDLCSLMTATVERVLLATGSALSDVCKARIKAGHFELKRLDINYMYELPSHNDVLAWIGAASMQSRTRHGRPKAFGTSIYWGLGSRRWMIKAYSKFSEVTSGKKDHRLAPEFISSPLLPFSQNKLRIELQLRTKELEKITLEKFNSGVAYAHFFNESCIADTFNNYLSRIEMNKNATIQSAKSLELPQVVMGTFSLWEQGFHVRGLLSKPTFYRHRKIIQDILSVDISLPKSADCEASTNVIPLLRELVARPAEIPAHLQPFIFNYKRA